MWGWRREINMVVVRVARLVLFVTSLAALSGCGGGSPARVGGEGADTPEPAAREPLGTAQVHVDTASGEVRVTPLAGSRAVFGGNTLTVNTSLLFDQAGNTGLRVLEASLTNHSGLAIGGLPDGTVTGLRVLFSGFTNLGAPDLDIRDQVTVSTYAGTGVAGTTLGPALTAQLNRPEGLAIAPDGTLFASEFGGHRIVQIRNQWVSRLAGSGTAGNTDGVGAAAQFNGPWGLAYDPTDQSLIVADYNNHMLKRVTLDGVVTRVAGTGTAGATNGSGTTAQFNFPVGVAVSPDGAIYVADNQNRLVRRVTRSGADLRSPASYTVETLAGSGSAAYADGVGTAASFNAPYGIAVGPDGIVYVGEYPNRRVRCIRPGGQTTTIAGTGAAGGTNGSGEVATFNNPYGLVCTDNGLVVAEGYNQTLRLITRKDGASGATASGWTVRGLAGTGATGRTDGLGNVATFNRPCGVAVDRSGAVYVADVLSHAVRRVVPTNGHLTLG
ncbi:MAG: hypothetical protein HYU66_14730, partial [Armatimonadetes bacterium]|nr:hypothetical protein [Armatimonadota bacterium]